MSSDRSDLHLHLPNTDPENDANNPIESTVKSELFVWRSELQALLDFAIAPQASRRLNTVAAPPGYGKTWLLRRLFQILDQYKDLFVIWTPTEHLREFGDLEAWLRDIVEGAKGKCPQVEEINLNAPPEAIIGYLLEKMCETCIPTFRVILIVDALDELPNNLRRELENRFLAQFWRKNCVRMVISFREDFFLRSHTLRRGELRITLNAFSPEQGRELVAKRTQFVPAETHNISFKDLLELVEPYPFNLPQLNTILSQKVHHNEKLKKKPLLGSADLRSAWLELINQPLASSASYAEILEKDLKTIVLYPEDSWSPEEFARVCGYNQIDAFNHWQDLVALSLVVPDPRGNRRYMVIDGLRELLRAEIRLRETENG